MLPSGWLMWVDLNCDVTNINVIDYLGADESKYGEQHSICVDSVEPRGCGCVCGQSIDCFRRSSFHLTLFHNTQLFYDSASILGVKPKFLRMTLTSITALFTTYYRWNIECKFGIFVHDRPWVLKQDLTKRVEKRAWQRPIINDGHWRTIK